MTSEGGNRVGVVGAGIAGLVTAKVLRDDGFDVVVFEKESQTGDVWAESRTYPGLRTNNSRDTYAFSDHPYDSSADVFPTAEQVRAYLDSYVSRFRLASHVRLSTEVVEVSCRETGFEVAVRGPDGPATLRFDFVVVCAGVFSEPHLPEIEGADRFTGVLLHSSQATDPALFEGRRVVVVGAGKSALDCAAWAGSCARSCTLVFRTPHWMAPRYVAGRIPADRLSLTRLTELFLRYHRSSRAERYLQGPGKILTGLFWRAVCTLFRVLLKMPAVMVPDERLPRGVENIGFGGEAYQMARCGELLPLRDTISSFVGGTELRLASGRCIGADVVIFATGWRQSLAFLTPELEATVRQHGRFQLYRHILPPTERRLGFVGYASSTACQLSAEISAHWLSQAFRGELTLPAINDMQQEINRVNAWLADVMPHRAHGYFIGHYLAHPHRRLS